MALLFTGLCRVRLRSARGRMMKPCLHSTYFSFIHFSGRWRGNPWPWQQTSCSTCWFACKTAVTMTSGRWRASWGTSLTSQAVPPSTSKRESMTWTTQIYRTSSVYSSRHFICCIMKRGQCRFQFCPWQLSDSGERHFGPLCDFEPSGPSFFVTVVKLNAAQATISVF